MMYLDSLESLSLKLSGDLNANTNTTAAVIWLHSSLESGTGNERSLKKLIVDCDLFAFRDVMNEEEVRVWGKLDELLIGGTFCHLEDVAFKRTRPLKIWHANGKEESEYQLEDILSALMPLSRERRGIHFFEGGSRLH